MAFNVLENSNLLLKINNIQNSLEQSGLFLKRDIPDGNKKSFAFAVFTLQRFLNNYGIEELLDSITDGGNDQSIDIFHIKDDEETIEVDIFQLKLRSDANLKCSFGENELHLFNKRMEELFIDNNISNLPLNSQLKKQMEKMKLLYGDNSEKKYIGIKINLHLVTNGADLNPTEKSIIDAFKYKNKSTFSKYDIINNYDFFFDDLREIQEEVTLRLSDKAISGNNEEITSYIVTLSAYRLAMLFDNYKDTILEKNVRKLLKGKTNEKIAESLRENPKLFWHKNNGLSIVCKRAEPMNLGETHEIKLESPFIVNGGQTAKTIYNYFKSIDHNDTEKMQPLYDAKVLARIYQTTDEGLIDSIVLGTNSQNKVTSSDLMSLNPNLKKIKVYFEENGVTLVTKRDTEMPHVQNPISAELLLQIYWAFSGDAPHKSKNSKSKLIDDKFEEVFSSTTNTKQLLNTYHIYKYVDQKNKENTSNKDISAHGIYAVLYTIKMLCPSLADEIVSEKLEQSYLKSIEILTKLIEKTKVVRGSEYSSHNYFKSNSVTEDIDNFFTQLI